MSAKRALIFSLLSHVILLVIVLVGNGWWQASSKPKQSAIEARLIFKKERKEGNLLPKKAPAKVRAKKKEPKVAKAKKKDKTPPVEKVAQVKKVAPVPQAKKAAPVGKKLVTKSKDFSKELAALSEGFEQELKDFSEEETPEISHIDNSYFDQIYALIKESFVVPQHINGPQGKGLQAVLRLFLASDGTLSKLDMERSSGDVHFDKAVKEGTLRVGNFGRVPVLLQDALLSRGIVVELCPFKCSDR